MLCVALCVQWPFPGLCLPCGPGLPSVHFLNFHFVGLPRPQKRGRVSADDAAGAGSRKRTVIDQVESESEATDASGPDGESDASSPEYEAVRCRALATCAPLLHVPSPVPVFVYAPAPAPARTVYRLPPPRIILSKEERVKREAARCAQLDELKDSLVCAALLFLFLTRLAPACLLFCFTYIYF